jgi:hypothetical protein
LSYVLYMAAATNLLALAGAIVDDRYRVEPFLASLPIRRELLVAARYLWCALAIALTLGLIIAEVRVLAARPAGVSPTSLVAEVFDGVMRALGPAVSVLLTVLVVAALGCISCVLSCRLYARRDL